MLIPLIVWLGVGPFVLYGLIHAFNVDVDNPPMVLGLVLIVIGGPVCWALFIYNTIKSLCKRFTE